MDFKEIYPKYLQGNATEEEKAFIEKEIEIARIVNSEIVASGNIGKKNKSHHTLKIIFISLIVCAIVCVSAVFAVYFMAISEAREKNSITDTEAVSMATEKAYIYVRDNLGYSLPMEEIKVKEETKELDVKIPLKKSHYSYDFEFTAGNAQIEIEIDGSTGICTITDVDISD